MNSQLYRRVKGCIYLLTFFMSIWIKWTFYGGEEGPFAFIVTNQIIYLPMLLMIGMMYFQYRYYHNTFIKTRFKSLQEVRYHHFRSNILEALEFLLWQLVIAIILGFHTFSYESFYALGIIVISLVLLYLAYAFIYTTVLEITNHYYLSFFICGVLVVAYRVIVYGIFSLGAYTLTYDGIEQNYILIIGYLCVIICCLGLFKFYFQPRTYRRINKKYASLILCITIEILSELFLQNQSLSYSSFALSNYFQIVQNNELFVIMLWLLPKIVLLYSGFMIFCERYRLNYTFYAVRIKNKRKWVQRIMIELSLFIIVVVTSKLIFHCLFCQVFDFSLLLATIEYFLYSLSWLCLLIVAYIIGRSESAFNYIMIIYIIINAFIGVMKIPSLQFLLLDNSLFAKISFIIFIGIIYNSIVYLMNHHEYY